MNPKPLLALNHFTVPCSFTVFSFLYLSYLQLLVPRQTRWGTSSRKQQKGCKCDPAALQKRPQRLYKSNKRSPIVLQFPSPPGRIFPLFSTWPTGAALATSGSIREGANSILVR